MNIKDLFFPFVLALSTMWLINYFFFGPKDTTSQHQFTAPQSAVECMPLSKQVQFVDTKRMQPVRIESVETSWAQCEFSTDGASLNRLAFIRTLNGKEQLINTVFPPESGEKESRAFLIGLNEQTPFEYRFVEKRADDEKIAVVFEGQSASAIIEKTFFVYKDVCKIDLNIAVTPKTESGVQASIFYPAPFMPELKNNNAISADVMYGNDTFKKIARSNVATDTYWVSPLLFGVENKYFIHSLVQDTNNFVQRAHYKTPGADQLIAILEGPVIKEKTEWTMSFYVGPKEESAIAAVDSRLEQALEYSGIWAPISRVVLKSLNWLYDYLHNYGWAIIVLTILIRLLLVPFSLRSERNMKSRLEQQKQLQYIKQKYKDDPQARAQAEMEFMRKHGLGLAGCLPMLAQVPIFFGLSRVLSSSIEMYKASFLWINDLSGTDPYYILPIIVVLGMLGSMVTTADPKQRMPMIAMSLIFGALSTTLSSGLALYIAVSTGLNWIQNQLFKLLRLVR